MKKFALLFVALVACMATASAQKFALVDMEYILKNIPAYEMANEQLNQVSQRWQREVDELIRGRCLYQRRIAGDEAAATGKKFLAGKILAAAGTGDLCF